MSDLKLVNSDPSLFLEAPEVAYVALGSNMGERERQIARAIECIDQLSYTKVLRVSKNYNTPPAFYEDQPSFINAAIAIETHWKPQPLLRELLRIEKELGRVRLFKNGPRKIDLDLILYGNKIIEIEPQDDLPLLQLPHPDMHNRRFVLEPLADVGADAIHPILQKSVSDLLLRLTV